LCPNVTGHHAEIVNAMMKSANIANNGKSIFGLLSHVARGCGSLFSLLEMGHPASRLEWDYPAPV
jgi:hypothetical protein